MNKKILSCTVAMLTLFLGVSSVNAKCSYAEQAALNKEAKNINVKYESDKEIIEQEPNSCDGDEECDPIYDLFINVNVLNLSENFYIDVKDSVTKKSQKYYFSEVGEDGILKIRWDDVSQINNFTITAYASDKTSCEGTKVRTFHITTPRVNEYSHYAICSEIPDYYLCQEYVTFSQDFTYGEFIEKVENEIKKQEEKKKSEQKSFFDKLLEFIGKYKLVIIASMAIIIILVIGTIIIIRKKRKL